MSALLPGNVAKRRKCNPVIAPHRGAPSSGATHLQVRRLNSRGGVPTALPGKPSSLTGPYPAASRFFAATFHFAPAFTNPPSATGFRRDFFFWDEFFFRSNFFFRHDFFDFGFDPAFFDPRFFGAGAGRPGRGRGLRTFAAGFEAVDGGGVLEAFERRHRRVGGFFEPRRFFF